MKPVELKVARIGNSRGVRLPAATLERYQIGDSIVMEERVDGILLRSRGHVDEKLSWEETARQMAAAAEDWSEWESAASDGIDELPWEELHPRVVAERRSTYAPGRSRGSRRGKRRS